MDKQHNFEIIVTIKPTGVENVNIHSPFVYSRLAGYAVCKELEEHFQAINLTLKKLGVSHEPTNP